MDEGERERDDVEYERWLCIPIMFYLSAGSGWMTKGTTGLLRYLSELPSFSANTVHSQIQLCSHCWKLEAVNRLNINRCSWISLLCAKNRVLVKSTLFRMSYFLLDGRASFKIIQNVFLTGFNGHEIEPPHKAQHVDLTLQ